jgi:hypothetical protein
MNRSQFPAVAPPWYRYNPVAFVRCRPMPAVSAGLATASGLWTTSGAASNAPAEPPCVRKIRSCPGIVSPALLTGV